MHNSSGIYYFLEKNRSVQQTFLWIFRYSADEYYFSSFPKLSINFCLFFKRTKKILPSSKEEKPGCLPFTVLKTRPERRYWLRMSVVYLSCRLTSLASRENRWTLQQWLLSWRYIMGASQMTTTALRQRSSK